MRTLALLASTLAAGASVLAAEPDYPLRDAVEFTPRHGLANVFAKLEAGQEVKIAYFGGSITAAPGWRVKTLAWFQAKYPRAKVSEVNAAIGGTGSGLGVFRLGHDVLQFKPDLMFVEFAVNDGGAEPLSIHRSMEGIIRKSWKALPDMDICYVYTVAHESMLNDLKNGKYPRAASAMEALADHYGIPSLHLGLEIARLEKDGKLVFKGRRPQTDAEKAALGDKMLFSEDGVHPLAETGHEVYAQVVARCMEKIAVLPEAKPGPHPLGAPLVADNWEAAKMVPLSRTTRSAGWQRLDPAKDGIAGTFGNRMEELWKAEKPGESITFTFRGTSVGIYDLLGPDCGQVKVKLDGKPETVCARFDAYCTYHRLASLDIGSGLPDTVHTVTVTVDAQEPDKMKILFEHNRPDLEKNPAKYQGTTWYAGAVMLIGDLAE
jgi:hypothetical protein